MGKVIPRKSSNQSKIAPARTRTVKSAAASRTTLGADLRRLRQKIIDSGIPLLTMEEIRNEMRSQRRESDENAE